MKSHISLLPQKTDASAPAEERDVALLDFLQRWGKLSLRARYGLASMRASLRVKAGGTLSGGTDIFAAGMVQEVDDGRYLEVPTHMRPAVAVVRAAYEADVFRHRDSNTLRKYLKSAYVRGELGTLFAEEHRGAGEWDENDAWDVVLDQVRSHDRMRNYSDALRKSVGTPGAPNSPLVSDALNLIRKLADESTGVAIAELASSWDGGEERLEAAIQLLKGRAFLFFGMDRRTLDLTVGILPEQVDGVLRPAPAAPPEVQPVESFCAAFDCDDMALLLSQLAMHAIPLRKNDFGIFSKLQKELEARMVPLPHWFEQINYMTPNVRVDAAVRLLIQFEFARARGRDKPELSATAKGRAWLSQTPRARLETVLQHKRDEWPGSGETSSAYIFQQAATSLPDDGAARIIDAMHRAFLDSPTGKFVALDAFLHYHTLQNNPIPPSFARRVDYYWGDDSTPAKLAARLWGRVLKDHFFAQLMHLGGIRVGYCDDRRICFSLTSAGRYLCGGSDTFEMEVERSGDVVVQPDFEVVLIGPNASAIGILSRFAERVTGRDAGNNAASLFRLTKASLLSAAQLGETAASVLDALQRMSTRPVPGNVEHQVRDWFSSIRRARLRSALIVECEDEESAVRAMSALRGIAKRLSPTTFEVTIAAGRKDRQKVLDRLRQLGMLVDASD